MNDQRDNPRPWWHTEHVVQFRDKLHDMPTPELRAMFEEMKGVLDSVRSQIETEGPELASVRELARRLGPAVVFDEEKFAHAIEKEFRVNREAADELVDDFDWWKSARRFFGYTKEKHSLVTAEIARRRAEDAERAVFDIKGKISAALIHLQNNREQEARELLEWIEKRLAPVGP